MVGISSDSGADEGAEFDTYLDDYFAARERIGKYDGLEKIGTLELSNASYQYDLIGAWKGADGFYLATDSGCSCPTPWENTPRDALTGPLTAEQAREEAEHLIGAARFTHAERIAEGYGTDADGPNESEADAFLARFTD